MVKKGKKEKKVPDSDEESLLLLSNDEAEEATPLRSQKKKELATKLPAAGSSSKVGTAKATATMSRNSNEPSIAPINR